MHLNKLKPQIRTLSNN